MGTVSQVGCIELNRAGLAVIGGTGVLAGDLLIWTFLYRWRVKDLLECYVELTPEMVEAAFAYAAENPDTPEGLFYFSVDIFPLLAATGRL